MITPKSHKSQRLSQSGQKSSRRKSATMSEHIMLLEYKCKLSDSERDGFESRLMSLELENAALKQQAQQAEEQAEESAQQASRAVDAMHAAQQEAAELRAQLAALQPSA